MSAYTEKLKDPRWQRKRLEVMQRDNFTCRDCVSTEKTLHVHHCHYERGNPWDTNSEFLLTLCAECHEKRQTIEDDIKHLFGLMNSASSVAVLNGVLETLQKAQRTDGASVKLILVAPQSPNG